jgi:hypothetical protein
MRGQPQAAGHQVNEMTNHQDRHDLAPGGALTPLGKLNGDRTTGASESAPGATIEPALLAAMLTAFLFLSVFSLLRPGYWINDDLKIAWLLAGYPGEKAPSPFPLHSSVIIGLILLPLFKSAAAQNWFTILLAATNALSISAMLYLVMRATRPPSIRILGCVIVLLTMALFVLQLTFTITAFLASLAGICLMSQSGDDTHRQKAEALAGIALVFLGSLIRLQMLPVALLVAVPSMFLADRPRRQIVLLTVAGLAVLAAYAFGRIYMRANPDWNLFFAYTQVRQSIHDSHRLFNVHGEVRRIGWTPNDQELFARWFFPDADLYSFDHLRYLEDRVSPYTQDLGSTLADWLPSLVRGRNAAYLIMTFGVLIWASSLALPIRRYLALAAPMLIAIGLNAGFAVTYKNPDYVQACTLAAGLVIAPVLLNFDRQPRLGPSGRGRSRRIVGFHLGWVGLAVLTVGAVLMLEILWQTSQTNALRREAYAMIRSDLLTLEREGIVPRHSLIVSPAHGLPYEWSDPFLLDRPIPAYLDMGWITFSPSYVETLDRFDIHAVPEALLDRDDVFLMTQEDFIPFLRTFYVEHYEIVVELEPVYQMPNPSGWPGYEGIFIFRLHAIG